MFNNLALLACIALLLTTRLAARAALRRGDKRQVRVLQFFRIGLSLSACSYLLHWTARPPGLASFLSLLCCFAGTIIIWIGWMEHSSLRRRQRSGDAGSEDGEHDDATPPEAAAEAETGLPRLSSPTRRVLDSARQEAERRRQRGVDTDHLLLGLLREPNGAAMRILQRLKVEPARLQAALGQPAPAGGFAGEASVSGPRPASDNLPLTDRACRALELAGYEAHRFGKAAVGTDHLLLGLLLMGTGAAAAVLFQEGATVDAVRDQVLQSRVRG